MFHDFYCKKYFEEPPIKPVSLAAVNYVNALEERKLQNLESFYNLLKLSCIVTPEIYQGRVQEL